MPVFDPEDIPGFQQAIECSPLPPIPESNVPLKVCSIVYDVVSTFYNLTSAKIIQLNERGCRDGLHHVKNHGNKDSP